MQEFFLYNDKGFVGYPGGSPAGAGQQNGVNMWEWWCEYVSGVAEWCRVRSL